jgi:hypothetical protein
MSQTMASPAPAWAGGLAPALDRFPHRRVSPESGAYGIGLYSKPAFRRATLERFSVGWPGQRRGPLRSGRRPVHPRPHARAHAVRGRYSSTPVRGARGSKDRFDEHLAICGDLNSVPWSSSFRHLASAGDLADSHSGHWLEGSWPSWGMLIRVPIDNCLISHGVTVVERAYGQDVGSDHFPLLIRLGIAAAPEAG